MLLKLFLTFLEIGAVSFGGGYGMISLIREKVLLHGWLSEAEFLSFIAVSESTPGPLAVNMATFIGSSQGGVLGALCATLGVVLPSFFIILLIAALIHDLLKYAGVEAFPLRRPALRRGPYPLHCPHDGPEHPAGHLHRRRRPRAIMAGHRHPCTSGHRAAGLAESERQSPFAHRDDPALGGAGRTFIPIKKNGI